MSRFMTRIELHGNATAQDYGKLHDAMGAKGFSRTIVGGDGVRYQLPSAEYYGEFSIPAEQVLERAKSAAATVWKQFSVVTTETVASYWSNLSLA